MFVLLVSLLFSYIVHETGSILGVTLAHGFTNIGLFLIFPFLITLPPPTDVAIVPEQRIVMQESVKDNWENEKNLLLEDGLLPEDCYWLMIGFLRTLRFNFLFAAKMKQDLTPLCELM